MAGCMHVARSTRSCACRHMLVACGMHSIHVLVTKSAQYEHLMHAAAASGKEHSICTCACSKHYSMYTHVARSTVVVALPVNVNTI